MTWVPKNPNYDARVRDSFSRQPFMRTIGTELTAVRPGEVDIRLPFENGLTQQHGFFHGGVIGTLADNAAAYAAFTLVPANDTLLTIEFKVNFLAPGDGDMLRAHGIVLKPGRRIMVSEARLYIEKDRVETLCATALVTLAILENTPDDKKV